MHILGAVAIPVQMHIEVNFCVQGDVILYDGTCHSRCHDATAILS